jgi:hypothetical protein
MSGWRLSSELSRSTICLGLFTAGLFALLLVNSSSLRADVRFDLGWNGGYTNNLLSDSTALSDRYSTASGTMRYYPLDWLEINLTGEYTYYDEILGLGNRVGRVGIAVIPLKETSQYSVYLKGSFDGMRYRKDFSAFDNNNVDGRISLGYRLKPTLNVRCGFNIQSAAYLASDIGDKKSVELFSGVNFSFWGRNSLDLEAGIGATDYRYINTDSLDGDDIKFLNPQDPLSSLRERTLNSFYFSPRYSRPLGSLTGMNLTIVYRDFRHTDALVFGSSVGLLSPWTSIWEGTSVTLNVKTYLVPAVITTVGVGYWNKTYLNTFEKIADSWAVFTTYRDDQQERAFVQMMRPISTEGGGLLQLSLSIDYTHNHSTNKLYKYSGVSIQTGISYRL